MVLEKWQVWDLRTQGRGEILEKRSRGCQLLREKGARMSRIVRIIRGTRVAAFRVDLGKTGGRDSGTECCTCCKASWSEAVCHVYDTPMSAVLGCC